MIRPGKPGVAYRREVAAPKFSDEFRAKLRELTLEDLKARQDERLLQMKLPTERIQ